MSAAQSATKQPKPPLARQLAASAQAIAAVLAGRSLTEALQDCPAQLRPGVQALSFQAMRSLGLSQALAGQMLQRTPEPQLYALILLALGLLEAALAHAAAPQPPRAGSTHYKPFVLVDQAVKAAGSARATRHGKNLLNAVLRRYGREREELLAAVQDQASAQWNHPQWWIDALREAWPAHWQTILRHANGAAPMVLRPNARQTNPADLRARLAQAGIRAEPLENSTAAHDGSLDGARLGLVLAQPLPVEAISGFETGSCSVQDSSAQLAAELLPLRDGMRVLDACAAPGGKTAHLLELYELELTALDADAKRLARVQDNLQRLGLLDQRPRLVVGDAAQPQEWWDGRQFQAILADVPCSASGVVRRHPDIRWLRRASDIPAIVALQARILAALWPLLEPGGHLLYATCSVFPAEGAQQIEDFIAKHPDATPLPAPGHILPTSADFPGDGFFYALLQKSPQGATK